MNNVSGPEWSVVTELSEYEVRSVDSVTTRIRRGASYWVRWREVSELSYGGVLSSWDQQSKIISKDIFSQVVAHLQTAYDLGLRAFPDGIDHAVKSADFFEGIAPSSAWMRAENAANWSVCLTVRSVGITSPHGSGIAWQGNTYAYAVNAFDVPNKRAFSSAAESALIDGLQLPELFPNNTDFSDVIRSYGTDIKVNVPARVVAIFAAVLAGCIDAIIANGSVGVGEILLPEDVSLYSVPSLSATDSFGFGSLGFCLVRDGALMAVRRLVLTPDDVPGVVDDVGCASYHLFSYAGSAAPRISNFRLDFGASRACGALRSGQCVIISDIVVSSFSVNSAGRKVCSGQCTIECPDGGSVLSKITLNLDEFLRTVMLDPARNLYAFDLSAVLD